MSGKSVDNALPKPIAAHGVCDNCGTQRLGPWCHVCGQHEDTAHHSVKRLSAEAIEHLANTDGKVFRTLWLLCLRPARLTSDYLIGRRVFFVMLVIFLFVADQAIQVKFETPTAQQIAQMPGWIRWIMPISDRIHANGGDFLGLLRQSSEIFGFLTVPVAALLLWALFAGRKLALYDHLIFSLHSLSFQLILAGAVLVLDNLVGPAGNLLIIVMAWHLFAHMRGVLWRQHRRNFVAHDALGPRRALRLFSSNSCLVHRRLF